MQQLVYRAQRAAAWTIQACGRVQEANGIKTVLRRIIRKQDAQASSDRRNPAPQKCVSCTPMRSMDHGRSVHRNAPFTSGFASTTSAQMPMGRPTIQHGEMQGARARMLEAIAQLYASRRFIFRATSRITTPIATPTRFKTIPKVPVKALMANSEEERPRPVESPKTLNRKLIA